MGLPPAPTLAAALAPQALQATETLPVDVAAGFAGRIDSYAAVSGDTDTLTVAVDGPEVALTGVAVGSTTVTVTAVNAAGRAARSFNVTVNALAAPQTLAAPVARTIAVGEELAVHVADAFSGIIASYGATSTNTNLATARVEGSTVTLTGVAAGAATVTLEAVNAAGRATAALPVTVEVPEQLAVAVAAPSHCLGSEGTLAAGGGRRGVGSIELTYHVTGGAGPYTITSPDAPDTTRTEPTGTLTVPCSRRGIDLTTAGPDANVVEAGPRTLTLTATDNTATATSTDIQIEIAEDAYTTEYNNGLMHEGRTYVLGTPTQWVLVTLPEGLTLRFASLSEHNVAHFAEPATGVEILLDWATGTELGRTTLTISDTTTLANTPTTTTKQTSTTSTPTTTTPLRRLTIATPDGLTYGADSTEWRPYAGLPISYEIDGIYRTFYPQVAVHPRMLIGEPIRVCAVPVNSATVADDQAFKDNVKASAKAWNDSINGTTKSWNPSFPRDLFTYHPSCNGGVDLAVLRVEEADIKSAEYCGNDVGGCARILATGTNPPTIGGSQIIVKTELAKYRSVMIHELGHFLGLGDYAEANNDKCGQSDPLRPLFASVMASGDCEEDSIQTRDLAGLHLVYHPFARTGMYFYAVGASGWELNPGDPPADTGRKVNVGPLYTATSYRYVSNAAGYVVFRRAFGSMGSYVYVGSFGRSASSVVPGGQLKELGSGREAIEGEVFYVYGVTRGDIEQSASTYLEVHATLPFDLGILTSSLGFADPLGTLDWTLGHGATVYGLPEMPANVRTEVRSGEVDVVWPHVAGATDYDVYRHETAKAIRQPTTTDGDPESFLEKQEVRASTRTSCGMRVTFDELVNGREHYFRVRAHRDGVELRSRLSEEVSGRPHATSSPPRSSAGHSEGVGKSASASSAASAVSCTLPKEVEPVEGDVSCPTGDGFSWLVREVVGGDPVCDRVESVGVVSTTVERCDAVGDELRVGSGGVVVCVREESGSVRSRLGPPECPEGFSLLATGVPPVRVCSRTESLPATATTTYECPPGYGLVTIDGVVCERSVPATATTKSGCPEGFSLVTVVVGGVPGEVCRRSEPAAASTTYSCPPGYGLVRTNGVVCYRSEPAASSTVYECAAGYSLVRIPLGGQYCRKTVPAAATYSCPSGYTRSGATCYKYTYTNLTGRTCPAGYTLVYNGRFYLCRKKLTTAAAVTYSCASGTLSGSQCVFTAAPTSRTVYSCSAGTLSGSQCVFTAAPTSRTVYSCSAGTLSGSQCVFTAAPTSRTVYSCSSGRLSGSQCILTATPTSTVTHDCDDAPAGYTLSEPNCVKTTTKPPTRPTIHYCAPGHTLDPDDNTCSRTITTTPTKITVHGCPTVPPGEPPYQITTTTTATGTTRTCARTITIRALTGPPTCPAAPEGEDPYQLTITRTGDGRAVYACTNNGDDE